MSKKKNTLSDLEAFLKQQASSIVVPQTSAVDSSELKPDEQSQAELSEEQLLKGILKLAKNKKTFYDFIVRVTDQLDNRSAEDVLLINTALYLKAGPAWREVIEQYWSTHR
jgi:uncharacterized protein YktB (UPF0637 family)